MTDELRERLNELRAASAFASSEDVQWLVDRVEEAEDRAADLADRELTALRTMEKAIKELADRDAKLAAIRESVEREYREKWDAFAAASNDDSDAVPRTPSRLLFAAMNASLDALHAVEAALSLSVPTSPTQAEEACETCAVSGEHELWCPNAPLSATMGELREALTAAIDLADVHESKSVGLYVEGEPVKPLTILGTRFMRGQFAFLLSVPTSRTCSAGIGGGETCDLPDGHEGPHSSDGIPVPDDCTCGSGATARGTDWHGVTCSRAELQRCICDGGAYMSKMPADWRPFMVNVQCVVHGIRSAPEQDK